MSRRPAFAPAAILLAAVVLVPLALAASGRDPSSALAAFVSGAFGDSRRVGVTLARSAPLLLTGLGVAMAFRAGLWNIGAEGQLIVGALAAVWVGTRPALASVPFPSLVALAAGALGGCLWALIAAVLRVRRGVPEVIATILLNFVAAELLSLLVQGALRESAGQYPQTEPVMAAAALGQWGPFPAGLGIGVLGAVVLHAWLVHTRGGFELRAAGLNPDAARAAGVRLGALATGVLGLSGGLAGLAGAAEVLGQIRRLYDGYAPGYGYTAIAVALLGRLEPLLVVPAALFFGALAAGSERMEALAQVPAVLSQVIQALVVFAGLLWLRRENQGEER